MEQQELPLGIGMALAMDTATMEQFSALSKAERQALVDGARGVQSKAEMRAYLHQALGNG